MFLMCLRTISPLSNHLMANVMRSEPDERAQQSSCDKSLSVLCTRFSASCARMNEAFDTYEQIHIIISVKIYEITNKETSKIKGKKE